MAYIVMESTDVNGLAEGPSFADLSAAEKAAQEWSAGLSHQYQIDVVDDQTGTIEASYQSGVNRLA